MVENAGATVQCWWTVAKIVKARTHILVDERAGVLPGSVRAMRPEKWVLTAGVA